MLPVDNVHVGCVIDPIPGAGGAGGGLFITMTGEAGDMHASAFVTVKEYEPAGRPETTVVVPDPVIEIAPATLLTVQRPFAGNPLSATLPVVG